jgi:hypothetical protein
MRLALVAYNILCWLLSIYLFAVAVCGFSLCMAFLALSVNPLLRNRIERYFIKVGGQFASIFPGFLLTCLGIGLSTLANTNASTALQETLLWIISLSCCLVGFIQAFKAFDSAFTAKLNSAREQGL